jgi:hypothetical protein
MYGENTKSVILDSAIAEAALATALAYNNAIGDEESKWTMNEPTLITRFSARVTTALSVTTAPVIALFRKAKTDSGVGSDDTSANAAFMTDSGEAFTTNEFVGWTIYNITDGSSGVITANTATTVTATLSGGTDNDWDSGDKYVIGYKLAEITIPTLAAVGNVYYADVPNIPGVSGTGSTTVGTNYYKNRGPAKLFAGDQLAVFSTTLGVGSAGAFQPIVIGRYSVEATENQSKLIVSA